MTEPIAARVGIADLQAIVRRNHDFWGERDASALHHASYVHEFGETSVLFRDDEGSIAGYLLGFVSPQRDGYIHVVAVREDARGEGLARRLYEEFERLARARGAVALKAITSPENLGSQEFHRALGFSASELAGYTAAGEARIVFVRELG
ncbi:MAG TPA: GNAT family N-acetyltransferase [Solirubrobacteraceae bacterium]